MSYTVVWFKHDLRIRDHTPLVHATRRGKVLCLHVIEPSLWAQPNVAPQHYLFVQECLHDLTEQLRACGARSQVAVGEVTEIFGRLHTATAFGHLVSHEGTGNGHTFVRGKTVARWYLDRDTTWREWPRHGVVRRLPIRDVWHNHWAEHIYAPYMPAPGIGALSDVVLPWPAIDWPRYEALGLDTHASPRRQHGERARGSKMLHDFLFKQSRNYRGGISSSLAAPSTCSRLSPCLAYGCLDMREVVQAAKQHMLQLRASTDEDAVWQRKGLAAFVSHLYWHCHFIQKLEFEPAIESRNLHRGHSGPRESAWDAGHFAALIAGHTGWPIVNACIAMLRETGWINFRMRAILVPVASYPLWLHWRPVGVWLARQFVDYKPGIRWSQMQMQAGTADINTTRVCSPIKQTQDQNPHDRFVRC